MEASKKLQIGRRVREKREQAGYTREKMGELSGLSPRFIANVEFGDATFSVDSMMKVCRVLSCSADYLLFGIRPDGGAWYDTFSRLQQLDERYQEPVHRVLQGLSEAVAAAERISRGEPQESQKEPDS